MSSSPAWGRAQLPPPVKKTVQKATPMKAGADLPYSENFDDSTFLSRWSQINVVTSLKWQWSQWSGKNYTGAATLNQRFGHQEGCDNWFISPALNMKQGMTYRTSFYLSNWFDASMHVYLLSSPTDTVNKTKLLDYIGDAWGTYSADFEVPADGDYYIAFHDDTPYRTNSTALSYQIYIDEFNVQPVSNNAVPAAVADLKQVPGANGEVSMGLKWTLPTLSKKGEQLDMLSYVKIFKDEEDSVVITDGVEPGAQMTWTDPNPTEGKHTYSVVVGNTTGESAPATVNTFVGIDMPGAPQKLTVDYDEGAGVISLEWNKPEFGAKGGWYDPSGLAYRIVRQPGNKVLEKNYAETSYEDEDLDDYGNYVYEVTTRNAAGLGGTAVSAGVVAGSSAALPIREDWEDSTTYATWTIADNNNDGHTWVFNGAMGNGGPTCIGYDYTQTEVDKDETLYSPPVELNAGKKYRVSFDVVNPPLQAFSLSVAYGKAKTMSSQVNEVVSLASVTSATWNTVTQDITPSESGVYYFSFWLHDTGARYFYMDNVRIEEVLDKNVEAASLRNLDTAPTAGAQASTGVTYYNRGTGSTSKFTVQLLDADGNVLGEQAVSRPLASGASGTANITWTVPSSAEGRFAVYGKVVMDGDECEGDNQTRASYLNVQPSYVKSVTIGTSSDVSTNVPFRYSGKILSESVYRSDDFQGFAGTIDSIAYKVRMGQDRDFYDQPFKVYMATTTQTDLNAGWIPASQMKLVFDGKLNIKRGVYDLVIPFTTPFDYAGGNVAVMVVGPDDALAFFNDGYGMGTYCTEYGLGASRAQAFQDYSDIDPMNPDPNSGSFFSYVPNTMFFINHSNTGSITGKVMTSDSTGVANATVYVGYEKLMKTTTAEDGTYSLPYVPAGYASLQTSAPMYQTGYGYARVTAGQESVANITVQKAEPITFTGSVCDRVDNTIPIAGATIILDGDNYLTATTDSAGRFSIDSVYSGRPYTFIVKAEDYETSSYSNMSFRSWGGQPYQWNNIALTPSTASPYTVNAVDTGDSAVVTWNEPILPITVSKGAEEAVGLFGGPNEMFIGQRFSPAELAAADVDSLYYISALRYVPMCTATFKLCIWQGETGNEALVYQEDMSPTSFQEWNTHQLTHPYKIDLTKSLVVGYKVEARTGSYPVGFDAGPAVEGGDVIYDNTNKVWTTARAELPGSMNYNWAMQAVLSNDHNAAPVEWVSTESAAAKAARSMVRSRALLNGMTFNEITGLPESPTSSKKDTAATQASVFQMLLLDKPAAVQSAPAKVPVRKQPKGYNVYRLACGDESNTANWTKLNAEPVTALSFTDAGWDTIPQKPYRFAVTSTYGTPKWGSEIQSDATFSDGVDKGRYATVTVDVTADKGDAQGAEVVLRGDGKVLKQRTAANGQAVFNNVHFNGYTLQVMKPYFNRFSKSVTVGDKNVAENAQLVFAAKPASMLTAVDYIHEARLGWNAPSAAITDTLTKSTMEYYTSGTFNVTDSMLMGQHFSGEDLAGYDYTSFYIDSINFYAGDADNYNVQLWSGLEGSEVLAWNKNVSVAKGGQWIGVRLDKPVLIDPDKSYYIGYKFLPQTGKTPVALDAGPWQTGGLMYYGFDYHTYTYGWVNLYDYNVNLMIAAHVTNVADPSEDHPDEVAYNVYRMKTADKADDSKWTLVNAEPLADAYYTDPTWEQVSDDDYTYAVKALYFGNTLSEPVFSKNLPKGQVSLATINVSTNNGLSAAGATVDIVRGQNEYHGVVGEDGSALIPEIAQNTYTVTVAKEGYDTITVSREFDDAEVSYDFQLSEIKALPVAVEAEAASDNQNVTVTWRKPGAYAPTEGWAYWDNGNVIGGFGSSTGSGSTGQLFTPEDQTAKGMKELYISKIAFYPTNSQSNPVTEGSNWTVKVWRQTADGFEEVASQRAEDVVMDTWNEVELDEPYYVSGDETLLVGYTFIGSGSVFGIDNGPCVTGKADWANFGQGWIELQTAVSNYDYNVLVHTYCEAIDSEAAPAKAAALAKAEAYGSNAKGMKLSRMAAPKLTAVNHPQLAAELPVKGYLVYRLARGNESDESTWTQLTQQPISELSYTDNGWTSVEAGNDYRWAVKAVYASGNSEPAFSGALTTDGTDRINGVSSTADVVVRQLNESGKFEVIVSRDAQFLVTNAAGMVVCNQAVKQGRNIVEFNTPQGVYLMRVTGNGLNYKRKMMLK